MKKAILAALALQFWLSMNDGAFAMSCENYASSAVSAVKKMKSVPKCRVNDSGRWNSDYNVHLSWCKGADQAAILSEYQARDRHLLNCGATFTF